MARGLDAIDAQLFVQDLFRQMEVQKALYRAAYQKATQELGLSGYAAEDAARLFAGSYPAISAHTGGAAIDLRIIQNGQRLDTGDGYPTPSTAINLSYPFLTFDEFRARQLFARTAEMAGLTVYPFENWHCSTGDTLDAAVRGERSCIYGPILDFDQETGAVTPHPGRGMYSFFAKE